MNTSAEEQWLEQLLAGTYGDQPPQLDFQQWQESHAEAVALLHSDADCSTHATGNRSWHISGAWIMGNRLKVAGVAAVALAAVLVGTVFWTYGLVGSTAGKPDHNSPNLVAGSQETTPRQSDSTSTVVLSVARSLDVSPQIVDTDYMGLLSLPMQVARAQAIVRIEMAELTDEYLTGKVTRVIYGRVEEETLQIWGLWNQELSRSVLKRELGREPTEDEVRVDVLEQNRFEVGRNAIVFLKRFQRRDGTTIWQSQGMVADTPPAFPLDDYEKKLVEVIGAGRHLQPVLTPGGIGPYVRASQHIVRAKLSRVDDSGAHWQVSDVVFVVPAEVVQRSWPELAPGEIAAAAEGPLPAEITVDLSPWVLRAETIAGHLAAFEHKRAVTQEAIRAEYDRLVEAELTVSREAILFVRPIHNVNGRVVMKLVAVLYDDPKDPKQIEQTTEELRQQLKGDWQSEYL